MCKGGKWSSWLWTACDKMWQLDVGIVVKHVHRHGGQESTEADLVIAADGPSSHTHHYYCQRCSELMPDLKPGGLLSAKKMLLKRQKKYSKNCSRSTGD